MRREIKVLLKILFIILSFFIYWWLESGLLIRSGDEVIKSCIFAIATFLATNQLLRKYLLGLTILSLFLTVPFYLFWQMTPSTFFGSIGVGMMTIFILSFLPELMIKGFSKRI